ncbi:MAG: hypothetical protein DRJ52_10725 [Thermoprotei archaeon]|nr:MAG: hypothetical protein DRJ52_10725 [Thermoprotei archaeon]
MVRREVKIFIEEELHVRVKEVLRRMPTLLKVKYGVRNISDFYELAVLLLIQSLEEELKEEREKVKVSS